MKTKLIPTLAALVCLALLAPSCGGSTGVPANPDYQTLVIKVWHTGNGVADVTLKGPASSQFSPVTYYIFGSNSDIGDPANIPLEPQRLNEQAFGPFTVSSDPVKVDFSPWDQYEFVYLRARSVQPNRAHLLRKGYLYEISTN